MSRNTSARLEQTNSVVASVPTSRNYKPEVVPVPMTALPFVYRPARGFKNFSNWRVAPTDDYGLACEIGRLYAAHFAQYMKDNPACVGANMLGAIAKHIDFKDKSGAKGYWVGFFSQLEFLIHAAAKHMDVFADAERINARYAEIVAQATQARRKKVS
ncbi:MAG: hypothetical protein QM639_16030 [Rhodocyclaceae bacterium]